ncbi:TetR family transcriptional regulator [Mycolicibacterium duvalii]|nr:TetR/AcrR family transcriptional regulator [Mycolicibacterium duvalii]MCV7370764.1 TetR/AcrR family transcriptional regulator [Mycolicibacterium duvalii]PEG37864.1 TetR family transcriptional regulator [Mycolicibacterium duvalii]
MASIDTLGGVAEASATTESRAAAAVARALDDRQKDAAAEVDRILEAAVLVIERGAPSTPRVADIVKQAGVSNVAFYRYFSGKDDLILAVHERGIGKVRDYVEHEMAKEADPVDKVVRWVVSLMTRVQKPESAKVSRVVAMHMATSAEQLVAEEEHSRPLRDLLAGAVDAVEEAQDPEAATDAIYALVTGELRRHLVMETSPDADTVARLVAFCLRGLGISRAAKAPNGKR